MSRLGNKVNLFHLTQIQTLILVLENYQVKGC